MYDIYMYIYINYLRISKLNLHHSYVNMFLKKLKKQF